MADIQVRCSLRSANNAPADDCINTFALSDVTVGIDDFGITTAFGDFYSAVQTGSGEALGEYLNDTIVRTDGLLIELIDDPGTPPNAPYFTGTATLPGANSNPLPQEVAMVLSYYTADYLTTPTPGRSRGRVYIGPLTVDAMTDGGLNTAAVPSANFKNVLQEAASNLKSTLESNGTPWSVWSRAAGTFEPIIAGWVDNEFDTQRRRGREQTLKSTWG